jgi:transcription elongation GreA/GreB family factor
MIKTELLHLVRERLRGELDRLRTANKQASSGAVDEESRAESKWDTQGLEASYLARGYARQYEELVAQLELLSDFAPESREGKGVGLGALVECEMNGFTNWFFLMPCCGGVEVDHEGIEYTMITPESPIGAALSGKMKGAAFQLPSGVAGTVVSVL